MVQNIIMGVIVAIIAILSIRFALKQRHRHVTLVLVWGIAVLWFFNSSLWGFSAVTVKPEELKIQYGFLSIFKNATIPLHTRWKISRYLGGIRKLENLYYFQLSNHRSLKVRGEEKLKLLHALGATIDHLNGKKMGGMEERPVNM